MSSYNKQGTALRACLIISASAQALEQRETARDL